MLDFGHRSFAPPSGLIMKLDERNCLAVFDGRPTEGNMHRPPAAPLWIKLETTNYSDCDLEVLVQQAYDLSVANWRGFNAKANPITTHYSKLLSRILSAIDDQSVISRIAMQQKLSSIPWFI